MHDCNQIRSRGGKADYVMLHPFYILVARCALLWGGIMFHHNIVIEVKHVEVI